MFTGDVALRHAKTCRHTRPTMTSGAAGKLQISRRHAVFRRSSASSQPRRPRRASSDPLLDPHGAVDTRRTNRTKSESPVFTGDFGRFGPMRAPTICGTPVTRRARRRNLLRPARSLTTTRLQSRETVRHMGNRGVQLRVTWEAIVSGNTPSGPHRTVTSTRLEFPGENGKSASWSVETENQKCTVPFPGAGVQVV